MSKFSKVKGLVLLSSVLVLTACGTSEDVDADTKADSGKVEVTQVDSKKESKEEVKEAGLDGLDPAVVAELDKDLGEINWDNVKFNKTQIKEYIANLNADGGEMLIESATISDDGLLEVHMQVNESSGFEDDLVATIVQAFLGNVYNASDFSKGDVYKNQEFIKFYNSDGSEMSITTDLTKADSSTSDKDDSSSSSSNVGKRSNPVPLGDIATTSVSYTSLDDWSTEYDATVDMSISNPIRGEDAWAIVQSTNQFNDPAPEGYEYLIVDGYFKLYDSETEDVPFNFYPDVKVIAEDGSEVDQFQYSAYVDGEWGHSDVYNGGTAEGKLLLLVPQGQESLVEIALGFTNKIFFKLQ